MFRRLGLAGFAIAVAVPVLAAPPGSASTVTVRIHDYAAVNGRHVQQAQSQVSETFARIGIDVDWRPSFTSRMLTGHTRLGDLGPEDSSLVVMLITGAMADRIRLPGNVAGYAATGGQSPGRVAFVVAERTERIAWRGHVEHGVVLGGVMAHELAHLLLPGRSHSGTGIMRSNWLPRDFKDLARQRFADEEVVAIRRSVAALAHATQAQVAD